MILVILMTIVEYSLLVIIIVSLLIILYATMYNKFQISIIRINEAEANIDSTLRKRYDLLNKAIEIIKNNTDEVNILENISNLRSQKLNNFELDRELTLGVNTFYSYIDRYPALKTNEQCMNISFGISETESEIIAFRKYYNDIITDYNKMVKTFPSNIVSLLCKYKKKTYFDGKEMDDVKL